MRLPTIVLCASVCLCACVSQVRVTKPGGDVAEVTFRQSRVARVELLALADSCLLFLQEGGVWRVPVTDLRQIRVEGYSVRPGKCVAAGCIGLTIAAFCLDVIAHNAWYYAAAAVPCYALGTADLLSDEPQIDFRPPLDAKALQRLALYCRYPQGLTEEERHELLRFYHQDAFLSPGGLPEP